MWTCNNTLVLPFDRKIYGFGRGKKRREREKKVEREGEKGVLNRKDKDYMKEAKSRSKFFHKIPTKYIAHLM